MTKGGLLQRPLALAATANGHILACNGKNGQVVEFDPASGKQLSAQWVDSNQAQSPPGNGDLFGLAMAPDGSGFYYVEDDTNMLAKATPMNEREQDARQATRRGFLAATAGLAAAGRRQPSRQAPARGARATARRRADRRSSRSGARIRAASSRRLRRTPISPPST